MSCLARSTTTRLTYSAIDSPVYPEAIRANSMAASLSRTGIDFFFDMPRSTTAMDNAHLPPRGDFNDRRPSLQ
jgi:hypothetical protein